MSIQVNDRVQWTINGSDQFVEPRPISWISECGGFCGVEGSTTGLPVHQITVVEKAPRFVHVEQPVEEEQEEFLFFWRGPFSQWHRCRFTVDNIVYNCAEQFMMAGKARLFGDARALDRIMHATDPSAQKKAGRAVLGFDAATWNRSCGNIVYVGNYAKFTQNPSLLQRLLETGNKTLVEASPYDKIWGIGLDENDPRARKRSTWLGANLLGELLTKLRNDLSEQ